eukprot:6983357-Pyramimonas_sp.AAC.1
MIPFAAVGPRLEEEGHNDHLLERLAKQKHCRRRSCWNWSLTGLACAGVGTRSSLVCKHCERSLGVTAGDRQGRRGR